MLRACTTYSTKPFQWWLGNQDASSPDRAADPATLVLFPRSFFPRSGHIKIVYILIFNLNVHYIPGHRGTGVRKYFAAVEQTPLFFWYLLLRTVPAYPQQRRHLAVMHRRGKVQRIRLVHDRSHRHLPPPVSHLVRSVKANKHRNQNYARVCRINSLQQWTAYSSGSAHESEYHHRHYHHHHHHHRAAPMSSLSSRFTWEHPLYYNEVNTSAFLSLPQPSWLFGATDAIIATLFRQFSPLYYNQDDQISMGLNLVGLQRGKAV